MTSKGQELKPDIILKDNWTNNEKFADLFNAVLFSGKEEIKPNELQEMDTDASTVFEHKNYAKSVKASRDNIKIFKRVTKYGLQLILLGEENQDHIHYAMPIRVMGYDYATYKKQYDSNAKKYRNADGITGDEYLSRMKKTDKFIPVITIVIYYGEPKWDGATTLHGMLDIPDNVKNFVNDYKMILVEAGNNNLAFHNTDNRDLFSLFSMMLDSTKKLSEKREETSKYVKEHAVSKSVIKTVVGVSKHKIAYESIEKRGGTDMWSIFEETMEEGRKEGMAKGREEGMAKGIIQTCKDLGLSDKDILNQLQKHLNVTIQKAQEYFNMFDKQTV